MLFRSVLTGDEFTGEASNPTINRSSAAKIAFGFMVCNLPGTKPMAESPWQKAHGRKPTAESPRQKARRWQHELPVRAHGLCPVCATEVSPSSPAYRRAPSRAEAQGRYGDVVFVRKKKEGSKRAGRERTIPQGVNRVAVQALGDGLGE